jgi:hypothetical protein
MQNTLRTSTRSQQRSGDVVIHVYVYLLKLYPAAFREAFADEMLDVFALSFGAALRKGRWAAAWVVGHELLSLPLSLWHVRRDSFQRMSASARRVQQARWFVRIIAFLLGTFLLSTLRVILSPSYNLYTQAIPFVVMLFLTSVSMLLAIRWERLGGLLTGSGGVALGIFMGVYVSQMATGPEGWPLVLVLIGTLWMLPFVIFGALFHQLSQHPLHKLRLRTA